MKYYHDIDSVTFVQLNGYNLFVARHTHMPGYFGAFLMYIVYKILLVFFLQETQWNELNIYTCYHLFNNLSYQHKYFSFWFIFQKDDIVRADNYI